MTLKDYESGAGNFDAGDRTSSERGATEMEDGDSFTFDTENVDPARNFHLPSIVAERKIQKIAVKVARVHPNIVTIGDYRDIPQDRLHSILRELNLPPRDVRLFTNAVQSYLAAAE